MTARHRLDPDIGYWAERWDPAGRVHPLYYTTHPNHRWVNVTTLAMLYAAYPLYLVGGYRLALLLPMLGSVLAALAARALARRVGRGSGGGWGAFWIVGLASPIAIYALDFWEHSLGVAAMAWAAVLLLDLVEGRRGSLAALAAGGLFGVAATLRNEAFVYGFVAVGLACVALLVRRRVAFSVAAGALASAGLCVPLLLNAAMERATMGDPARLHRAASTASGAGALAGRRLEEALLNAVAITPLQETGSYLVGAVLVLLLAFLAVRASRPGAGPVPAAVGVLVLYVLRFDVGLGFVPSLVATTPVAVVGLTLGWSSPPARYLLATGLAALPLVWATQFQGGAAAQWGGRYLLVSGLLFAVVGVVALEHLRPWARAAAVGFAVLVTAFGLAWTATRTHGVAREGAVLAGRPEPVLVSRIGHLARENGAFYRRHRWLTAPSDADQAFAVRVLERAGITRFGLVDLEGNGPHRPPPGWRTVGTDRVDFLSGFKLSVTTFQMA